MEGMSAFAGVYGKEMRVMRPERRHMEIALFKAARSGDVQAFRSLVSARHELPSSHDFEATVVIHTQRDIATLNAAAEDSKLEIIFGVTVGGNTVLHIAAQHGHLDLATEVCRLEPSLVAAVNTRLETPLHCCARAGHDHIVSLIIDTARSTCRDEGDYDWLDVLRARNVHGETALHEALRFGHELVAKKLIEADNELASFVSEGMSISSPAHDMSKHTTTDNKQLISADHVGLPFPVTDTSMSPLYLAVMTKSQSAVEALLQHDSSAFSGPGGRTALHAAVVTQCQKMIIRKILKWKPVLGRVVDESHSTPLHYVAADGDGEMARILLEHDPSTAYISDKDGYFPIHVAAGMNHVNVICEILDQCPDSCELVDHNGRSFLHVAVERSSRGFSVVELIVNRKKSKRDLEMLLNQRDNYGNTPMHLAVSRDNRHLLMAFTQLLKKNRAKISIMNNLGLTPLDLSILSLKSKPGMGLKYNAREVVTGLLVNCGAIMSPHRHDHVIQWSYNAFNEEMEAKKSISIVKNLAIISVLFATVTFAAGFTIPGGYKSDDGTSIMANKYPFKVFLISNAFALLFSLVATMQIIYIGTPASDISIQKSRLYWSLGMLFYSFVYMSMSFGMATLVVVAPKNRRIGYLVCILSLAAPSIHIVRMDWSLIEMKRVIIKRNGLMMRSKVDPRARKYWLPEKRASSKYWLLNKLHPSHLDIFNLLITVYNMCAILLLYSIVFLLALV